MVFFQCAYPPALLLPHQLPHQQQFHGRLFEQLHLFTGTQPAEVAGGTLVMVLEGLVATVLALDMSSPGLLSPLCQRTIIKKSKQHKQYT